MLGVFHPDLWQERARSEDAPDPDAWLDPFLVSAAFASRTDLPLGIGVTDSTRRRAPDVVRTALTLHHMCRGGFNLGIGSGEAESLVPFGYPYDKPVGRCEEFLAELRCLLDTGQMPGGMSGRTGIPLETEMGKPKVWVAGHGPRMLRLTGQYGDGWLPAWSMEPEDYAAKRAVVAQHAEAAGRPIPESGLLRGIILGESREQLAELFEREPLAKLAALFVEGDRWERYGLEHPGGAHSRGFVDMIVRDYDPQALRDLAPKIPFELLDSYFFCGNAEEIFNRFAPFADVGMEHTILTLGLGMIGGLPETEIFLSELARLRSMLAEI
jgi:phthiodiolone/phenolphthiodiolone dimycocerosates ketoreductase